MPMLFRFKCPQCGMVQDVSGNGPCRKCHVMVCLPEDGVIQIYRTIYGNKSMEIFINGIRLGCLGRRPGHYSCLDTVRIPVSYGHYQVMAKFLDYPMKHYKGMGLEFDITPQNRFMCLKASRTIPGYTATVVLEPATAEEIQQLNSTIV